jgi:hypothetical protein
MANDPMVFARIFIARIFIANTTASKASKAKEEDEVADCYNRGGHSQSRLSQVARIAPKSAVSLRLLSRRL